MAKSTRQTGTYYRNKTKAWYEAEGYTVENLENKVSRFIKTPKHPEGQVISVSKDVFGADLLASNGVEILFIQAKQAKGDRAAAIKTFAQYPWPICAHIKRVIVRWEPRAREPMVTVLER